MTELRHAIERGGIPRLRTLRTLGRRDAYPYFESPTVPCESDRPNALAAATRARLVLTLREPSHRAARWAFHRDGDAAQRAELVTF